MSTDDEEREISYSRDYEKKIGHLMDEVGELKSEVQTYTQLYCQKKNLKQCVQIIREFNYT